MLFRSLAKKRNQVILVDEGWLGRGIATIMRQHHFDKLTRRGVTLCPKTRLRDVTNHMVSLIDVTGNEYVKSVDWIVTASLRDIDNSPLEWLEGQAFEVIYVNPAQSPREWSEGMREGTAIARRL